MARLQHRDANAAPREMHRQHESDGPGADHQNVSVEAFAHARASGTVTKTSPSVTRTGTGVSRVAEFIGWWPVSTSNS